jgi:hypothetical protein
MVMRAISFVGVGRAPGTRPVVKERRLSGRRIAGQFPIEVRWMNGWRITRD